MEINSEATKCPHCQTDLRSWPRRHPILTVILVLLGFGFLSMMFSTPGSQKDSTTASNNTQVESAPKSWVTVIELSGNANKRSDTFSLTGGKTRLSYSVEGSMVIAAIYVMDEGRSLESDGGFPEVTVSEAGSDSTFLTKKAGNYYLDVSSANASWAVRVEEER